MSSLFNLNPRLVLQLSVLMVGITMSFAQAQESSNMPFSEELRRHEELQRQLEEAKDDTERERLMTEYRDEGLRRDAQKNGGAPIEAADLAAAIAEMKKRLPADSPVIVQAERGQKMLQINQEIAEKTRLRESAKGSQEKQLKGEIEVLEASFAALRDEETAERQREESKLVAGPMDAGLEALKKQLAETPREKHEAIVKEWVEKQWVERSTK